MRLSSSDVSFDLRDVKLVPSKIRDQGRLGLCWTFSALAAVESNYMVGVSVDGKPHIDALCPESALENPHASELYLGWFARYHPNHDKSYLVFSTTNSSKELLSLSELRGNPLKVLKGAAWKVPVAMMSRGLGPIAETAMSYDIASPFDLSESAASLSENLLNKYPESEDYERLLWVTDVSFISYPEVGDDDYESKREAVKKELKNALVTNGAVSLSYIETRRSRNSEWATYFCALEDEKRVRKEDPKRVGAHAVTLIGWDDNVPVASFDVEERKQPEKNGAWLIRNSWGASKTHKSIPHAYYEVFYTVSTESVDIVGTLPEIHITVLDDEDDGKKDPISDNTKPTDPEGEKFYGVGGANSGCDFGLGGLAVIVGLAVC